MQLTLTTATVMRRANQGSKGIVTSHQNQNCRFVESVPEPLVPRSDQGILIYNATLTSTVYTNLHTAKFHW